MIAGCFHSGSGLGNQLHRYIATRVLALDKGYDFSMVAPENFKGKSFMNLDMGIRNEMPHETEMPSGKVIPCSFGNGSDWVRIPVWEEKTNYCNPEFNFIEDNTIIDGEFQDERYFGHRMNEIDQWLKVEPMDIPDDTCVLGFRGGEFKLFPELFLTAGYWREGIKKMLEINPNMKFEIHTDDIWGASDYFKDLHDGKFLLPDNASIIHDIGINWRSMRYAKYAIIANSSFYILPRLLRHSDDTQDFWTGKDYTKAVTIAPRYWARRNTKEWSMPSNYYRAFTYI